MKRRLSTFLAFISGSLLLLLPVARAGDNGLDKPEIGDVPELGEGTPPKMEKVAYLGVTAKSVDAALGAQLNLPGDTGLTVTTVDRKGPAAADLQVNDVLQKLDDQILIDSHQLVTLIHLHKPGDSVTLTVIRQARPVQVTIKLGEKQRVVAPANQADHVGVLPGGNQAGGNLPGGNLPGVNLPDDPTTHAPFDPQVPLGPNSQLAMSFSDGTYSADIKSDTQGRRHMVVKDQTGQVVAQGPVDTEEEWQKFSADVRQHLEIMHKQLGLKQK